MSNINETIANLIGTEMADRLIKDLGDHYAKTAAKLEKVKSIDEIKEILVKCSVAPNLFRGTLIDDHLIAIGGSPIVDNTIMYESTFKSTQYYNVGAEWFADSEDGTTIGPFGSKEDAVSELKRYDEDPINYGLMWSI